MSEILPGEPAQTARIRQLANELYQGSRSAEAPSLPANSAFTPPPVHPTLAAADEAEPAPTPDDNYAFGAPHSYISGDGFTFRGVPLGSGDSLESPGAPASTPYYFLPREAAPQAAVPAHPVSGLPGAVFDVERARADFPALHQKINGRDLIWLDNAATTHKPQAVIDATSRFYARDNSNIHRAAHTLAARSTDLFEKGRDSVARFLGAADSKEIVFVRGTTEGINLIAQTYGRKFIGPGDEILLTTMEHHANIVPWQLLAEQTGAVIRVAPINDRGELIVEQFAALLSGRTKLVALTHVANSIGTINPVEHLIALAHAYGIPVLVDGAQSTPHLPVNVRALDADFYVFSGHKVFGPTGIGAVYGKAEWLEQLPPWQGGGHMIKDVTFAKTTYQNAPEKFEAGTPDIAGVVGLGAALDYLMALGIPGLAAYEHELLVYATEALAGVPKLRPIGTAAVKASVLGFVIDGTPVETVARHLDQHGIAVRAGHHCAMPTLRRLGVEATVRPSLAFYNTREEVDALVRALHLLPKS